MNEQARIEQSFDGVGSDDAPEKKCNVLLVDDQEMVGEGIRRMLEDEADIEFHYCADPSRALETAIEIKPTVIIQDLVMPDIDGMTLVRFYKNHPETRDIPIIVLSSKEDATIKSEAFSNGASDYLVKLPEPIELVARVRSHSKHFLTWLERNAAYKIMEEMQDQLAKTNKKLAQRNAELQRLSNLDGLTGVANRRSFDNEIKKEWCRARRTDGEISISLILIDIDHFKLYNDGYGHQKGDDCLIEVARILNSCVTRGCDMFARYGGEEFVALLIGTDKAGAMTVAKNMQRAVEEAAISHEYSQVSGIVTLSMGIATMTPGKSNAPEQLIENADQALYRAKEKGRNQIAEER